MVPLREVLDQVKLAYRVVVMAMVAMVVGVVFSPSIAADSPNSCSDKTLSLMCGDLQDSQQCCRCTIPRYCGPSGGSITQPGREIDFDASSGGGNFTLVVCVNCITEQSQTSIICEFITEGGTYTQRFRVCIVPGSPSSQPVSPTPDMQSPTPTPTPTTEPDDGAANAGIIVGVVVFIAALLCVLGVLRVLGLIGCFYCINKKRESHTKPNCAAVEFPETVPPPRETVEIQQSFGGVPAETVLPQPQSTSLPSPTDPVQLQDNSLRAPCATIRTLRDMIASSQLFREGGAAETPAQQPNEAHSLPSFSSLAGDSQQQDSLV